MSIVKDIVYLHGYQGENSVKYKILKEHFEGKYAVEKPEQTLEPYKNLKKLEKYILERPGSFLIGSSLGGFYALILSMKYGNPSLLINPSYAPHEGKLKDLMPPEFKKQFISIHNSIKDFTGKGTFKHLNLFIAEDDEVINHKPLLNDLAGSGANIKLFSNKGHGFAYINNELEEIEKIIERY